MSWRAPFPRARATWARSLLLGIAMAVLATGLRWSIATIVGYRLPFVSHFPFLLAASIWGGVGGGVIALAASAVAAGALFFAPDDPLRVWALGSFVIAGLLIIAAGAMLAEAVRM